VIWHGYGIASTQDSSESRVAPLLVDISDLSGIEKAYNLLGDVSGDAQKAVGSAIKRAAIHARKVGMKLASDRYAIGQNILKRYTKWYNHQAGSGFGWVFGYRGYLIPLAYYDTTVGADGKIHTRVLKSSAKKTLDHAFLSTGLSYNRVRQRIGPARYPTEELYGPSGVSALTLNEDKVEQEFLEEFDRRIDHEILAVLNGWRM